MEKGQISRRTFIKGMTAGAIRVAALGGMQIGEYAVTSDAIKAAVADCMSQASGATITVGSAAAQDGGMEALQESVRYGSGAVDSSLIKVWINESGPYEFIPHSMYMQPYHTYCDIFDSNSKQYAEQFDEDYGKEKHRMTPVDRAPFFGIRMGAWHLTTLNGCRINADMQVIKEDDAPIEGLYATGDCTGGFFATTYPNLFTGLACGRTMTFARHEAKLLAAK